MGALGGNRLELPSGPGLRDALIDCFSIQADDDTLNLSRIYAAAVRKDPVGVHKLLCDWFTPMFSQLARCSSRFSMAKNMDAQC